MDIFLNQSLIIVSVFQLRLVLEDRAGDRIDLVVIFHIARLELDLVDERAVLIIQLNVHVIRLALAHARMVQGDGLCLGIADVLHRSGRRGLLTRGLRRFIRCGNGRQ